MLERLSPHLSDGGYFVLDDVYMWSGAKAAYIDFFQVDLEWLQTLIPKKECWTTVTCTNGKERYFRLALEIRAIAQVVSATNDSMPKCIAPTSTAAPV